MQRYRGEAQPLPAWRGVLLRDRGEDRPLAANGGTHRASDAAAIADRARKRR